MVFTTHRIDYLLDLVFSTDPESITLQQSQFPLSKVDALYHPPIEFLLDISVPVPAPALLKADQLRYNFKKANFEMLNQHLTSVDWEAKFSFCQDSEVMVNAFYDVLHDAFEKCIPKVHARTNNHPPWFDRDLASAKNRKHKAYKKYKWSRRSCDQYTYSRLRKLYKSKLAVKYKAYMTDIQHKLTCKSCQRLENCLSRWYVTF